MKTTLLFSTAVLLSMATFAQTPVKNQQKVKSATTVQNEKKDARVNSSGSASSSSSVNSNAVSGTQKAGASASEKGETVIANKKNHSEAAAKSKKDQGEATLAEEKKILIASTATTEVTASEKDNKVSENASLTGVVAVNAAGIQNNGIEAKNEVATVATSAAAATVVATNQVKPAVVEVHEKVKAVSATKVAATSSVSPSIKAVPAIKANGNVKVNTVIRIQ